MEDDDHGYVDGRGVLEWMMLLVFNIIVRFALIITNN